MSSIMKTLTLNLIPNKLIILFLIIINVLNIYCSKNNLHTNEFAVQVLGSAKEAEELASRLGFVNKGQVGSLEGYYLFEHNHIQKRSTEPSIAHANVLQNDPHVLWFEQQQVKVRVKRNLIGSFPGFSDPLYPDQWFLHRGSSEGYDMNVIPAWQLGVTGKGVVVSILDDGIQTDHPDLMQNYDKDASWDINGQDNDPTPRGNGDNKHGTRCAGEVAAVAYNEFCGVGIAFNASIGGVRMLDGSVTDSVEASALSLRPDHIHIYSASWGPEDDGKTVDGPGKLAKLAFTEGIKKGRSGLGSIYVWASGNGGRYGDSCNCDGYTNSIYTISISSATQSGHMPWYLEQCSSTLATTYSSGAVDKDKSIVTVDVDYSYSRDSKTLCTENHTGTSASAPIAAGICALALEANPNLTWRDMQYLVLITSRAEPLLKETGWVNNGVGRQVSPKFGYGLMDAAAMVKLARKWKTLPNQHICTPFGDVTEKIIPSVRNEKLEATLNTTNCKTSQNSVLYLEHVEVKVTLHFKPRGNLHIVLISPAGTPSTILLPRLQDTEKDIFNNWPFMSVHFWGENPEGIWTLVITNSGEASESVQPGKLVQWSLVFYGTEDQPIFVKNVKKNSKSREHVFPTRGVNNFFETYSKRCFEDKRFELQVSGDMKCTDKCPEGWYGDRQDYICRPCDKSCQSCFGPSYDNCILCPLNSFILKNICVKSCPSRYFADSSIIKNKINRYCYPCSSTCETCQHSFEMCSSCKKGLYLYKQRCLAACPNGTYMLKYTCKDCHNSCESCSGPYFTDCLSCKSDSYLFNSTCISECPEVYYATKDFMCVRCHHSCRSCKTRNTCSECNSSWEHDLSGQCIWRSSCMKGWKNEISDTCEECAENCDKCSSSEFQCGQCSKGYYWLEGQCVSKCPKETFLMGNECVKCSEACSECKGYEIGSCLLCKDGFLLHDTMCVAKCPTGFYNGSGICLKCHSTCSHCTGSSNKNCTLCSPGYFLFENSCLIECPDGYFHKMFRNEGECLKCPHLCKSCAGMGSTQCVSCYGNFSLVDGACIPCLDNEFFNKEIEECGRCHNKCGRCYGPSEHNCLSCQAPFRLDEVKHNCLQCCDNESEKVNTCCTCSENLDVCINSAGGHPRSIARGIDTSQNFEVVIPSHILPVVILICLSVVVLFVVLFGILQARSMGWCNLKFRSRHYQRVPSHITTKFDAEMEKISFMTQNEDEDEDIYEKA